MPEMPQILAQALQARASDVLIVPGEPPVVRIDGRCQRLEGAAPLPPAETKRLIYSILNQRQIAQFEKTGELDFPLPVPNVTRFRVNVYLTQQGIAGSFRPLAVKIPKPDEIGLTPAILNLAALPRGLVLVVGPTGSGKTTTLASLVQHINDTQKKHIITIEEPIEFIYPNSGCFIDQREVGLHTISFAQALKSSLRENPDVILVGEMRDLETIELAIKAAETGHLCLSTLHTKDAPSTIDRIVSEFPSEQQNKIRLQLATVLKGVVSQVLVPKRGGGRACAREVMMMNASIGTMIREGRLHQIPSAIQGAAKDGMCSMDQALAQLILSNVIDVDVAWEWASDINTLQNLISNLGAITTAN